MKSKRTTLFLIAGLLSAFTLTVPRADEYNPVASPTTKPNKKDTPQLILVAFKDASINRGPSSASAYRKRGHYTTSGWSERVSDDIADNYHLQKVTEWPMTAVGVHCIVYKIPQGLSVPDTLRQLAQDSRVDIAQNMHTFSTRATQPIDPYYPLQSNLQKMHVDEVHSLATGKNVTIAMIDTGVDLEHPDLVGQISDNKNLATDISADFLHDKHGTAVAGVMVAKKNGTGIIGIAPDANLIALKACWPMEVNAMEAVCNSYTLAMAVNSAIDSGAKILNMSLTGPQDSILELLLNKAIDEGMIVVASDNGQADNFPASMKNVIPVRSLQTDNSQPTLAPNLSAPSEKILTTLPYGTYDFISGSSIAAAEVSGTIALLLELNADLTLKEIQGLLQKTGESSQAMAFPGINALTAVLGLCENKSCSTELLALATKKRSEAKSFF